ncbi:hypothetical protein [Mycolicibacterium fortuitum]|uniref:hypothetical protein n=1 Tax=Mycolicibacterium fortuitum TaxID=1766 RepID=UPI001AEFF49E|nr:hypothetical protein [Mycolicibacterium fortuitum]MBP3083672.1 hypothetical protein [Mycolicibacterium fortuitum]
MVSIPDIEQWDVSVLEQVKNAALNAGHSLRKLGDGLDATRSNLDRWHGDAAQAWRAEHGKTMVDVDDQHRETATVADVMDTAIEDTRWCINELKDARAEPESLGMTVQSDGSVVDPQAGKTSDKQVAQQRENVRAAAEQRLKALLAKATATDVEIGNALRAAVSDKPLPVPAGAPHTDPAVILSELQDATNQAVLDQMAKIRAIQKQLDDAMKAAYTSGPGTAGFDEANANIGKLRGELVSALNDLGNIPDYSKVDPKSVTVSPDGHFLFNRTENGITTQVYGRFKNGTGEFFDQAKGTSYTFKDGKLASTNTPDPGRVTPDDELLFNAVTLAVGHQKPQPQSRGAEKLPSTGSNHCSAVKSSLPPTESQAKTSSPEHSQLPKDALTMHRQTSVIRTRRPSAIDRPYRHRVGAIIHLLAQRAIIPQQAHQSIPLQYTPTALLPRTRNPRR